MTERVRVPVLSWQNGFFLKQPTSPSGMFSRVAGRVRGYFRDPSKRMIRLPNEFGWSRYKRRGAWAFVAPEGDFDSMGPTFDGL